MNKMRVEGRNGFALLLIVFGVLVVLHKFGFGHWFGGLFGSLFGLVVPLAMLFLGYVGFKSGRRIIGGVVMTLGAVLLFGHLSGLIGIVIAIALIGCGISLLKRNNVY